MLKATQIENQRILEFVKNINCFIDPSAIFLHLGLLIFVVTLAAAFLNLMF